MRVRFLVRIVLFVGSSIYTFGLTVATNVATCRDADPFACTAHWDDVTCGEEVQWS